MNTGKTLVTIVSLATLILAGGCASTGNDLVPENILKIEKVPSRWAALRAVSVVQDGDEITLRGKVTRRSTGRGPIPGHIDLEVIGPDERVVEKSVVDYHRRSVKSRYATFHATLNAAPPPGSTLRIIHDTRSLFSCEQVHCAGGE